MKRGTLLALVLGTVALALAGEALGKGPASAQSEGPGLAKPIAIRGDGEPGSGSPLGRLVEQTGFFAVTVGQIPDPVQQARPDGELGPAYTIPYPLPGPHGATSRIRTVPYPYAKPAPVSFTRGGQLSFTDQLTYGGWIIGTPALRSALVAAGLPESAPRDGDGWSWWSTALVSTAGAAASALLLLLLFRRRRPRLATRTA
jgi:hypothetical protein